MCKESDVFVMVKGLGIGKLICLDGSYCISC